MSGYNTAVTSEREHPGRIGRRELLAAGCGLLGGLGAGALTALGDGPPPL